MLLPTHSTHILPLRDKVADELGVISKVNVPAPWWSSLRRSCAPYISTWITNPWTKVCRVSTLCQRWTRQWQSWPEPRANLLRIVSFGRSPYPPTQNSWLPPSRRSDNFALTLGLPAHRRSGWVPSCLGLDGVLCQMNDVLVSDTIKQSMTRDSLQSSPESLNPQKCE